MQDNELAQTVLGLAERAEHILPVIHREAGRKYAKDQTRAMHNLSEAAALYATVEMRRNHPRVALTKERARTRGRPADALRADAQACMHQAEDQVRALAYSIQDQPNWRATERLSDLLRDISTVRKAIAAQTYVERV